MSDSDTRLVQMTALPRMRRAAPPRRTSRRGLRVQLGVFDETAWARWVAPSVARCTPLERDQEALLWLAEDLVDRFDAITDATDPTPASPALIELARAADALLECVERAEDRGVQLTWRADEDIPEAHDYRRLRAALLGALLEHSPQLSTILHGDGTGGHPPRSAPVFGTPQPLRRPRGPLLYWLVTAMVPGFEGERLLAPHVYLPVLLEVEARQPLLSLLRGRWSWWPGFRPSGGMPLTGRADLELETEPASGWALASLERTGGIAMRLRRQLRRFLHLQWLRRIEVALYQDLLQAWRPELDEVLARDYEQLIDTHPWDEAHQACWDWLIGERVDPPAVCPVLGGPDSRLSFEARLGVLAMLRELVAVVDAATSMDAGLYVLFE